MSIPFEQTLFQLLVCPQSKAAVVFFEGELVSTDAETRLAYPVEEDVPIMLIDRARTLDQVAWQTAMDKGLRPEPISE